jgi:hypothetical protein
MKKVLIHFLGLCACLLSCHSDPVNPDDPGSIADLGIINFSFFYQFPELPEGRIKRLSLRMAYTEDSLNLGLFFTSTNVSDVVNKYQISLPEGTYYYQATIMCLCALDSCKYSGFSGQYGTKAAGNKVEVYKNQVTEVTTQFH